MDIASLYNEIKDEIINIRRTIHQNPELAFEEFSTAKTICSFLEKHSVKYTNKIAKTGICAQIGKGSGKTLLIRADMDALPTDENTGLDFASKVKGKMHACGHDIHIASALAAAYILKQLENELDGCVKIVFQPAEETTGGALPMINEGILENPHVCAAIGGHVTPALEVGKVWVKSGALMASPDDFGIKFIGKSTHGAEPQNGISPILPAAEFISGINNLISKEISFDPDCVLSICTVSGGNSVNIIPSETYVAGTFRSFSKKSREAAAELIEHYAVKTAEKYGAKCEVKYNFLYPPLINNIAMTDKMEKVIKKAIGENSVIHLEKPLMTGEDFSYFAQSVPSVFIWYGGGDGVHTAPLHSDKFIADEGAIEAAAKIFCEFAADYLTCK